MNLVVRSGIGGTVNGKRLSRREGHDYMPSHMHASVPVLKTRERWPNVMEHRICITAQR